MTDYQLFQAISQLVKTVVKKNHKKVSDALSDYLKGRIQRLQRLYALHQAGDITQDFFEQMQEEEKELLRMHLLEQKLVAKQAAEEMVNGTFDILGKFIRIK